MILRCREVTDYEVWDRSTVDIRGRGRRLLILDDLFLRNKRCSGILSRTVHYARDKLTQAEHPSKDRARPILLLLMLYCRIQMPPTPLAL